MTERLEIRDEAAMRALGGKLSARWGVGDVVFLSGPLGAGKTTLVRGLVESLGVREPVRSPTFNLIQTFPTQPPVMHADLYRVASHAGIGIEDYLDTHLCLIEWPDRATGMLSEDEAWSIEIEFAPSGRIVTVRPPKNGERSPAGS